MAICQKYYLHKDIKFKSKQILKETNKQTKKTKGREENKWICCKSDKVEVALNSYVVKTKSSGMRNVLLL